MKSNTLIWVCLFIILVILGGFYFGKCYFNKKIEKIDTIITTKTDTLWKDTTIWKYKTVPKYINVIKRDTVYDKEQNPIELVTENKVYQDTIVCAKDTVAVTSYIRGINASQDSIKVWLKKSEITKTNTIEITKYIEKKRNRIHIVPNVSVGYGLVNKKPDIYVGIGVGIDI